jgi:GH24 family phage-related lysozyme (muramidase)
MNIKDLASVAAAATIATTGVDADINKAVENNILPPHIEEKYTLNISDEDKNRIQENEGFVDHIYPDHLGNPTIGTGHLITEDDSFEEGKKYSKELLDKYYVKDLKKAATLVDELIDKSKIHPKAYGVLVEMAFQMGSNKETKKGLAAFEKTITAINAGEYKEASKHMLWNYNDDGSITKTKWNAQLPKNKRTGLNRAERLSKLMANVFVDN